VQNGETSDTKAKGYFMNNGIDDSQEVPDVDNITGIDNSIDDYVGTDGDDELIIVGCPGTVYGGGGNDGIWGNFYDDRFDGGDGNDRFYGGWGDNSLNGGSGDDLLSSGKGHQNLTGGEGNDIFKFMTPGDFVIHDFDVSSDLLNFESTTTGLHDIDDLFEVISGFEDTDEGVIVHFVDDIAAITLIGLHSDDLSAGMVSFT